MLHRTPNGRSAIAGQVRRSWMMIPGNREDQIELSWTFGADVVVLDLEDLVHGTRKQEARANVKQGIAQARKGGAEVFVRCNLEFLQADLEASVWRGLQGVMLPKIVSPEQVVQAEEILARLEAERGVKQAGLIGEVNEMDEPRTPDNSIEIHLALEDAAGNHRAVELLQASRRVRSVSLGRVDLVMDLRAEPNGELHLMPFLMQRLIAIAHVLGVVPIGAWWQGNSRGLRASAGDTLTAATLGRAAGFKGAACVTAEQVEALNKGFTPTESEVTEAEETVRAYQRARELGEAYGQLDGVRIGAAAASGARELCAWAALCAERDRFKVAAADRARNPQN